MTVGLHISVRAGPTITSANLAIHYDSSEHEEPTRPAPPTTTTTTTTPSNVTGTGTTTAAATTTAAPTTAAPTTTTAAAAAATAGSNPAPRFYTSSTGTDDDTPITNYEKVVVQQVSSAFVYIFTLQRVSALLHSKIKNAYMTCFRLESVLNCTYFQPVYLFVEAGSYRCSPNTNNGGASDIGLMLVSSLMFSLTGNDETQCALLDSTSSAQVGGRNKNLIVVDKIKAEQGDHIS